ncbi:antitoxin [Bordetella genomosp. 4]|uniref:Antitoxin n=2 Tax=Bordetella genomosp. 4 TaxID=463044 RepID=A0A261TPN5_9BORD|nr:antitoxin [Bordetella genomosp. 4]
MGCLTMDVTDQQHQTLKTMATLEGKTIKQYALERLFPQSMREQALYELKALLNERLAQAERGEVEGGSITDIAMTELRRSKVQ